MSISVIPPIFLKHNFNINDLIVILGNPIRQEIIKKVITAGYIISLMELSEELKTSYRSVQYNINFLVKKGIITKELVRIDKNYNSYIKLTNRVIKCQ